VIRWLLSRLGMNRCDVCEVWYARRRVDEHYLGRHRQIVTARIAEQGRRLASEREDLIAAGVDPSLLEVPLHPDDRT